MTVTASKPKTEGTDDEDGAGDDDDEDASDGDDGDDADAVVVVVFAFLDATQLWFKPLHSVAALPKRSRVAMPNGGGYGWCWNCHNWSWVHDYTLDIVFWVPRQLYCDPCVQMWYDYYRWWAVYYVLHGQVSVGLQDVREDANITWAICEFL